MKKIQYFLNTLYVIFRVTLVSQSANEGKESYRDFTHLQAQVYKLIHRELRKILVKDVKPKI